MQWESRHLSISLSFQPPGEFAFGDLCGVPI
jgi:hypothetical protein